MHLPTLQDQGHLSSLRTYLSKEYGGRRKVSRATIGQLGQVLEVKFLNGSISLLPATSRAIRQWSYRPTLLDKRPVQAQQDVTIEFRPPQYFVEGVKSASIPQWTTLDVSPLRKGPQQLSRPRSDAVALCSGPKAPLINRARTVKGKSRTLCVRPSCEYIRRQFFDKGETPHLQSQNRREESLFGDHCNVLNGNAVYSEESSG